MSVYSRQRTKLEPLEYIDTPKGVKIPLRCVYSYPDGHGYISLANGKEIYFDDEYDAIEVITAILAGAKKRAKAKK